MVCTTLDNESPIQAVCPNWARTDLESRPSRKPRRWRGLRWTSWTTPSEAPNAKSPGTVARRRRRAACESFGGGGQPGERRAHQRGLIDGGRFDWARLAVGEGVRSCPRAGCGRSACPVRRPGIEPRFGIGGTLFRKALEGHRTKTVPLFRQAIDLKHGWHSPWERQQIKYLLCDRRELERRWTFGWTAAWMALLPARRLPLRTRFTILPYCFELRYGESV